MLAGIIPPQAAVLYTPTIRALVALDYISSVPLRKRFPNSCAFVLTHYLIRALRGPTMEVYADYTNHSSETVGHVNRKMGSSRGGYEKNAIRVCGDWSEQLSSKGKIYFYNCVTEVSQWQKPPEWKLPDMEPDELLRRLSNREHLQVDGKNLKRSRLQVVNETHQIVDAVYEDRCGSPKRSKFCNKEQSAPSDLQSCVVSRNETPRVFGHRPRLAPKPSPKRNCFQGTHSRRPVSDSAPSRTLPADDMDISPNSSPMSDGSSPILNHRSPYSSKVLRTGLFTRNNAQVPDVTSKIHREFGTHNGTSSRTGFSGQSSGTLRQLVDAIRASIGSLLDQSPAAVSRSPIMKSHRVETRPTFPDSTRPVETYSCTNKHPVGPRRHLDDRVLPSPFHPEREQCPLSTAEKRQLTSGCNISRENVDLRSKSFCYASPSLSSPSVPSAHKHTNSTGDCPSGSLDHRTVPTSDSLVCHQIPSLMDGVLHQSHLKSCRSTAECYQSSRSNLTTTPHSDSNLVDTTPCREILSPSCSSHSSRPRSQLTEEMDDCVSRLYRPLDIQPTLESPLLTLSSKRTDSAAEGSEMPLVHSTSDLRPNSSDICDSTVVSVTSSTSNPSHPSSYVSACANLPSNSAPLRANNTLSSSDDRPHEEEHCDRLTRILHSPSTQTFVDPLMVAKFSDRSVERLEQEALLESRKFDRLQSVLYGELSAESKKLRALVRISEAKLAIHREKQTALQDLMDAIETRKQLSNLSFSDDIP